MKVLLIDDHRMVNTAISSFLRETKRFKECVQVNTLDEAKDYIAANIKKLPDLIILDILLGEDNGLDFLPFLNDFCTVNTSKKIKKPPVLVCSALEEAYRVQAAFKLNAQGYIGKSAGEKELLEAIDTVLAGGMYISEKHSEKLAKSYALYDIFSKREHEILNLIKEKKTNQEIADKLNLNIRSVENYISNIYFKTGAENRQKLMMM